MDSPESVLIVHASEHAAYFLQELRKQWPGMLVIHVLDQTASYKFQFFSLDGEVNPVSGRYEVARSITEKLSKEEQQKLYEELHQWGHRIY